MKTIQVIGAHKPEMRGVQAPRLVATRACGCLRLRGLSAAIQASASAIGCARENDPLHISRAGSGREGMQACSDYLQRANHGRRLSVESLRELMNAPSLEGVFSLVTEQRDWSGWRGTLRK